MKAKKSREEECKHKITRQCVIEEETEVLDVKPLCRPPSGKSIHQTIIWDTRVARDPSSLIYTMHLSPPSSYSNKASRNHVLSSFPDPAIRPIASAKAWLLPMLPSSTKTSFDTQNGCGKCLGYQPLKNLKMERQDLRKTTIDCVENFGHNNLSLSRIVARVFSMKSTPFRMWVMWVYIVCVETQCIIYNKLAKQNVSRVSHGKALPARYSRKPTVTICHDSSHSSHVQGICFTSREGFSRATRENFLLFTLP